jgi:hypothetical protein
MKDRETRRLQVEAFGRAKDNPKSLLRIKGRWLRQAGFPPRAHVDLTVITPGVMEIRLCSPPQLLSEGFTNCIDLLTRATARADAREGRGA